MCDIVKIAGKRTVREEESFSGERSQLRPRMNSEKKENESSGMQIDEALYSRQLYVLGHEAQRKMAHSNILIVGLTGLGVEVAKNIILAGVKSVTLLDDIIVTYPDLSTNFYLTKADVGNHTRSQCCIQKLAELNPYVHVTQSTSSDVFSSNSSSSSTLS